MTEAGDGEDGRIKSALGIGALLADGLGRYYTGIFERSSRSGNSCCPQVGGLYPVEAGSSLYPGLEAPEFNYLCPPRRKTRAVRNIGVNTCLWLLPTAWMGRRKSIRSLLRIIFMPEERCPNNGKKVWTISLMPTYGTGEAGTWPAFNHQQLPLMGECSAELKFLFMPYMAQTDEVIACLKQHPEVVVVSQSNHPNRLGEHRALVHQLMTEGLENPVVFFQHYAEDDAEDLQIKVRP